MSLGLSLRLSLGNPVFALPNVVVPPAESSLAPASTWTGTPGSGYGGANLAEPVDPVRTTAKPVARLLTLDYAAFSGDLELVVQAEAKGGIANVEFFCEGNSLSVPARSWSVQPDVNGIAKPFYGYSCTIDGDAARALAATGTLRIFARATANDGTMQQRVIGPFLFYPRQPGVGANCVINKQLFVDKQAASDTAGVRYRTIVGALNWLVANPVANLPEIILERAGDHAFAASVTTESGPRASWTIIRAAAGINATIGDGSALRSSAGHQFDGMKFTGANLQVDLVKISPNLAGFRLRTNSNMLLGFDGVELMMGANTFGQGSGAGMNALWDGVTSAGFWISTQNNAPARSYFLDCTIHDLADYGPGFCFLARGNTISNIGGSCFENVHGALVNNTVNAVGGPIAGLRTYLPALTITNSNPAAQIEITGNVGASARTLRVFPDAVTSTPDYSIAISKTASTNYNVGATTKVAAVAAGLDALAYLTATETPQNRAAAFLTLESLASAAPVSRRDIGAEMTLATFVDVHANAIVWHNLAFENVLCQFMDVDRLVSTNLIGMNSSADGIRDFFLGQITTRDTSVAEGYPVSGGYINEGGCSHLRFVAISQVGGNQTLGATFSADGYSEFRNSHLEMLSWTGGAGARTLDISRLSLPVGQALPEGADGNSVVQAVASDALFVQVTTPPLDFTPRPALTLGGQVVGAKSFNGEWNVL